MWAIHLCVQRVHWLAVAVSQVGIEVLLVFGAEVDCGEASLLGMGFGQLHDPSPQAATSQPLWNNHWRHREKHKGKKSLEFYHSMLGRKNGRLLALASAWSYKISMVLKILNLEKKKIPKRVSLS